MRSVRRRGHTEACLGKPEADGSVEGLGLEADDYLAAAAYFESMDDADIFADVYDISPDNIVEVQTFCLD